MVSGILLLHVQLLCVQLKAQRCHQLPAHDEVNKAHTPAVQSSAHYKLTVSLFFTHSCSFLLQSCIFLDSGSNRAMYLLFTAVCKIQISFSLNANVQRSCSSALNAMLTACGTSGNAPNCREESDISVRRGEPGG